MFNDLELINIHLRSLYTVNSRSQLLFVNEPDNATIPAPRMFLGRTIEGNVWGFRAGLPHTVCEELNAFCDDEPPLKGEYKQPPRHLEAYLRVLEPVSNKQNISNGIAYQFPGSEAPQTEVIAVTEENEQVLRGGFEGSIQELPAWQPFVALIKDNRAVSICRSARITTEAHEAGVETLEEFRGNGYANKVVLEWARRVRQMGRLPMYSTSWENVASQAVARKLGLRCYGVTFEVT